MTPKPQKSKSHKKSNATQGPAIVAATPYDSPLIRNPDSIQDILTVYNPDNLPSHRLIMPFIPDRLTKLVPTEFSLREQNFHLMFFLWYEQANRLPSSLPKIAQEYTNFYCLYRIVTLKMGGFERISHSKDGEWAAIWKNSPNFSSSATSSASSRVKSTYSRFLFPFEKEFYRGSRILTWKLYWRRDANQLKSSISSGKISNHPEMKKKLEMQLKEASGLAAGTENQAAAIVEGVGASDVSATGGANDVSATGGAGDAAADATTTSADGTNAAAPTTTTTDATTTAAPTTAPTTTTTTNPPPNETNTTTTTTTPPDNTNTTTPHETPSSSNEKTPHPQFIMETTWKLFEPGLMSHLISQARKVSVDQHFIRFPFQKPPGFVPGVTSAFPAKKGKKKAKTAPPPSEDGEFQIDDGDDSMQSGVTRVASAQVGDILYSGSLGQVLLVIAREAPIGEDFELLGRITPSADFTMDDMYAILDQINLDELIQASKERENATDEADNDLLLAIQPHEVTIEQHSRPHHGLKRKRKSPKKPKKSKRVKGKDGKKKEPALYEQYPAEEEEYYGGEEQYVPARALRHRETAYNQALEVSGLGTTGISRGTMTQTRAHVAALGESSLARALGMRDEVFIIRYKFNQDADSEYRVIHIPTRNISNGELSYGDLKDIIQRDNVSMDAVCEIRSFSEGLGKKNLGWMLVGKDWKFSLDTHFARELTLWLLTKKGYMKRYGVPAEAIESSL